jgi:hypothetical protein
MNDTAKHNKQIAKMLFAYVCPVLKKEKAKAE